MYDERNQPILLVTMTASILLHLGLSLLTLLFLEIIMSIDNLVFLSITTSKLPKNEQKSTQRFGLLLALVTRLLLLSIASWLAKLNTPLFNIYQTDISIRNLIFIFGGIFLIYKATHEIHQELSPDSENPLTKVRKKKIMIILQIALLDIIFSFDSVITAVGMTNNFLIMATAIILSIALMIMASHAITQFIEKNPSIKMLAISFILMIGTLLVADGFHAEIPRGYIYFSITFSLFVETLNILVRKKRQPIDPAIK